MWYRGSINVPAGTARAAYESETIEICPGVITKFYRLFPPGCAGLVGMQVWHQTRQVFPTTPGTFYLGDGSEILGEASVDVVEPEYLLELRAWAPDADYDHVIYCEFYIARPIVYVPVVLGSSFVSVPVGLEGVS